MSFKFYSVKNTFSAHILLMYALIGYIYINLENIFQRHNGIFFIQESFDFAKLEFCALTEWGDARLYTSFKNKDT